MTVLIIGGGGREHAIAWKLAQSSEITRLLCAPGNAGIASVAQCFPEVLATDIGEIVTLARRESVDYVMVAPDDPLAMGLVDRLLDAGIPAFGPNQAAAKLEASKFYSKRLMKKHGIPTAAFWEFDEAEAALAFIDGYEPPMVVKADGLALGKGAVVAKTRDEARAAVQMMMVEGAFGESGSRVLIEECLTGREVTLLCFTDGETIVPMPASQDHKRALDNDKGLNTGGMGAFTPSPLYTDEITATTRERILLPTLAALKSEGIDYRGVLYVELMLTDRGPMVIEYNARFGDPEAQAVLPLLETDLMTILRAVSDKRLRDVEIKFTNDACVCVVIASGGYPGKYATGKDIAGIADAEALGAIVFHAGTRPQGDNGILTAGGRVLGVTSVRGSLNEAVMAAYAAAERIRFEGAFMRRDIGKRDGIV